MFFCRLLLSVKFHANIIPVFIIPVLLLSFYHYLTDSDAISSLILFVFLAGAIGGMLNTYTRLKKVSIEELNHSTFSKVIAITQVYATPMVAGIFAIVSYALFASGLLQGSLFPSFSNGAESYSGLKEMFSSFTPETRTDAVKCIVWGFIAGFSEKMIPNILDRMAEDGENSQKDTMP